MNEKYFFHDIKGQNGEIIKKGIAVKDTFEAAKQAYHAYLGAYAYGNETDTDFVSVMISDMNGVILMAECWKKTIEPESEVEPEEN